MRTRLVSVYFFSVFFFLALSRFVVYALTGLMLFTLRASSSAIWLRRNPVFRLLVCFFGLPIKNNAPYAFGLYITRYYSLVFMKSQPIHNTTLLPLRLIANCRLAIARERSFKFTKIANYSAHASRYRCRSIEEGRVE